MNQQFATCSPRCSTAHLLRPLHASTSRYSRHLRCAAAAQQRGALDDWESADSKEVSRMYSDYLPKGAAKNVAQWREQLDLGELDPELPQRHRTPNEENIQTHTVQWYPGHIARAERQLKEQLKMVDVVLEVRDARIPVSTCHPSLNQWLGSKPCLLVFNRVDMITRSDRTAWAQHFKQNQQRVYWTDGKQGDGIKELKQDLVKVGVSLNEKRKARGLNPRPVRACVIGFPNIGKSAIINRLLNKRIAASAPKPGVTRILQWIRVEGEGQLDLLDSPGIIPGGFGDQVAAQRLAMCNDIGEAAYVDSIIASAFIMRCRLLPDSNRILQKLQARYKVDPRAGSAEDFVQGVADNLFFGDREKAGLRILNDYRMGYIDNYALERPDDMLRRSEREAKAKAAAKAKEEARRLAKQQRLAGL
jgi:ribosome biogenesis GTP-binding protein YlqF